MGAFENSCIVWIGELGGQAEHFNNNLLDASTARETRLLKTIFQPKQRLGDKPITSIFLAWGQCKNQLFAPAFLPYALLGERFLTFELFQMVIPE